ncbi:MAG: amidohydrolase family protein [Armatimonadetes bacterium]|nr:amidohydrolase family protein [Armatimonadota bacterium]
MTRRRFLGQAASFAPTLALLGADSGGFAAETALIGGRVLDPESKTDKRLNVGMTGGRIVALTSERLNAKRTVDVSGLVVCPGFIDPISHGQDMENDRVQVLDGVTTKLQLESGAPDVDVWYDGQKGRRLCHYGTATGHGWARTSVLGDDTEASKRAADEKETAQIADFVDRALKRGALAVGFGLEYRPQSGRKEVLDVFAVAARHGVACHCHVRYGTVADDQSAVVGIQEVLADAVATGAGLHVVHVPSMGLSRTEEALRLIERAQARGLDVTCDFYPYTAFGTEIGSEVFAEGWQQRFGIDYGDVEWGKTHERLTRETFEKYRAEGGFVAAHAIPERAVVAALVSPASMIGTDGGLENGVGHPRSAGTYARILGRYVRQQKAVSLMTAVEKATLRPAKRMEKVCPDFKRKGRVKVGCDADLCVFDPETVIDQATFDGPARPSVGFRHVFVGGVQVVDEGQLVEDVRPGRPLRGKIR